MECPFCDESDFDKIGLKNHLMHYCNEYAELDVLEPPLFAEPRQAVVNKAMEEAEEWVYHDKPVLPGWYVVMFSWEIREGIFIEPNYFDGDDWDADLPVIGYAGTFANLKEAAEWGEKNDPEGAYVRS